MRGMVPVGIHVIWTVKFDLEVARIVLHIDSELPTTIPLSENNLLRSTIYLKAHLQLKVCAIFCTNLTCAFILIYFRLTMKQVLQLRPRKNIFVFQVPCRKKLGSVGRHNFFMCFLSIFCCNVSSFAHVRTTHLSGCHMWTMMHYKTTATKCNVSRAKMIFTFRSPYIVIYQKWWNETDLC